eukprot:670884-Ditylum_brightwellii.AAC.1
MAMTIGLGWAESVCNRSQYCSGVPMEEASDGRMPHPCTRHILHKVGFQFLELTPLLLQHLFDAAEAVNP